MMGSVEVAVGVGVPGAVGVGLAGTIGSSYSGGGPSGGFWCAGLHA